MSTKARWTSAGIEWYDDATGNVIGYTPDNGTATGVLTVGASGCPYTTVQAAVDAAALVYASTTPGVPQVVEVYPGVALTWGDKVGVTVNVPPGQERLAYNPCLYLGTNRNDPRRDTPCSKRLQPNTCVSTAAGSTIGGATKKAATFRSEFPISVNTKGLRVVYSNTLQNLQANTNSVMISCCLEAYNANGTLEILPITFGGVSTYTMTGGEVIASDAYPNRVFYKDERVWVRTRVSVANDADSIPMASPTIGNSDALANDKYANDKDYISNATITDAWTGDAAYNYFYCPLTLIGQQVGSNRVPVVCVVGDSISVPSATIGNVTTMASWYAEQLNAADIPYFAIAASGQTANTGTTKMSLVAPFLRMVGMADYVVCALGRNDLTNTGAASALVALDVIWDICTAAGCKVWQTTITPNTNYPGNAPVLTVATYDHALNDSIRAVPSPLTGYLEIANSVTTSADSGDWAVIADQTADGIHPYKTAALEQMGFVVATALSTGVFTDRVALANQAGPKRVKLLDTTLHFSLAADTTAVATHRHLIIPRGILRGMVIEAGIPAGTAGGAKTVEYAVGSVVINDTTLDGTHVDVMAKTTASLAATQTTALESGYVDKYYLAADTANVIFNATGVQADASKSAGTCIMTVKIWALMDLL